MITTPLPRLGCSWRPSKSPAEREWSSTGTANRRTAWSSEGPFGTAQERSILPISRRRSKCKVVASCCWTTNRAIQRKLRPSPRLYRPDQMPADDDLVERADSIRELARERLGFVRLRPGQLRAAAAPPAGGDVRAVLPTGGGKSAIYELAGLVLTGPTVIISPLIALQDDQLGHLRSAGLSATVLNSKQSVRERREALAAACRPDEYVFLSPEQLSNDETRETLRNAGPGLFVVDEAHLISQWGEDFRPDYLRLGAQADALEAPVRLALTATAAPPVRQEIVRRLELRSPEVVVGDFDR